MCLLGLMIKQIRVFTSKVVLATMSGNRLLKCERGKQYVEVEEEEGGSEAHLCRLVPRRVYGVPTQRLRRPSPPIETNRDGLKMKATTINTFI
jgi:hypothetical protein